MYLHLWNLEKKISFCKRQNISIISKNMFSFERKQNILLIYMYIATIMEYFQTQTHNLTFVYKSVQLFPLIVTIWKCELQKGVSDKISLYGGVQGKQQQQTTASALSTYILYMQITTCLHTYIFQYQWTAPHRCFSKVNCTSKATMH